MNESSNTPWFSKKKSGIGWGLPITWQGWIVLLMYVLLSMIGPLFFSKSSLQFPLFLAYFAILTLVFIGIAWKKGARIDE